MLLAARLGFFLALTYSVAKAGPHDFGQVAVNGGGSSVTLTYSFTGLSAAPSFTLAWYRDFQLGSPSCNVGSTTCTIVVTFNPLRPGRRQDTLTVRNASGNTLAVTPLEGVGTSPLLALYPGIISTLAGNGTWGYVDSSNPLHAEFRNPQGLALDSSGNAVYVADSINGVIREIVLSTGVVSTVAGNGSNGYTGDGGLATNATLNAPTGVAVDSAGNIYIADQGNNRIRRVDAKTNIINSVAGGGTGVSGTDTYGDGGLATSAILYGPQGVAVDSADNLYIADTYHQLVRGVSAVTGVISIVAGGGSSAGTDGYGNGGPAVGARLGNPVAVALDSDGNLYIADAGNNLIRQVNAATGVITAVAGNGSWGYSGDGGLATSARLATPQGVSVDAANNIYIADYANNAIRQVRAGSQTISTLAGRGSNGYSGDGGNPQFAFLTYPTSVVVDENGNLYLADYGDNVVRQISYSPSPLTFVSEPVGALSPALLVSPFNIGNQSLNLSSIGFSGTDFQQVSPGLSNCAVNAGLSPGASCNLWATFSPTHTGSVTGTLTLTTNSLNNTSSQQSINLAGTALTGTGPKASFNVTSLVFPVQLAGTVSAPQTVTLTNSGGTAFTISSIAISGPQSADFQITNTTCGSSLATSVNCTVSVIFYPSGNGSRSASLLFNDSVVGTPQAINLIGTGNSGIAGLNGSALSFSGLVGVPTAAQSVILSNSGSYPLQILGLSLSGTNSSEFQASTTCATTVPAKSSCSFSVLFTALAAGTHSATLSIFDNSDGSPQTVTLNATAVAVTSSAGLRFVPITPCRIADTRLATGLFGGPILAPGVSRDFVVPSSSCNVPTSAQAYSLNFTIVPPVGVGYISVWPTGQPQPTSSLLNSDGRLKANATIIPAGTLGAITVYASNATHMIVDVNGYFVAASNPAALGFFPVTPCRVVDTRQGTSYPLPTSTDFLSSQQFMRYTFVRSSLFAESDGHTQNIRLASSLFGLPVKCSRRFPR